MWWRFDRFPSTKAELKGLLLFSYSFVFAVPVDEYVYDLYALYQHSEEDTVDMEDYPMWVILTLLIPPLPKRKDKLNFFPQWFSFFSSFSISFFLFGGWCFPLYHPSIDPVAIEWHAILLKVWRGKYFAATIFKEAIAPHDKWRKRTLLNPLNMIIILL